jgi:hypothetical protein
LLAIFPGLDVLIANREVGESGNAKQSIHLSAVLSVSYFFAFVFLLSAFILASKEEKESEKRKGE